MSFATDTNVGHKKEQQPRRTAALTMYTFILILSDISIAQTLRKIKTYFPLPEAYFLRRFLLISSLFSA